MKTRIVAIIDTMLLFATALVVICSIGDALNLGPLFFLAAGYLAGCAIITRTLKSL